MSNAIRPLYDALNAYAEELDIYAQPYLLRTHVSEDITACTLIASVARVDYITTYVHNASPTITYCINAIFRFTTHVPPWRKNLLKH